MKFGRMVDKMTRIIFDYDINIPGPLFNAVLSNFGSPLDLLLFLGVVH